MLKTSFKFALLAGAALAAAAYFAPGPVALLYQSVTGSATFTPASCQAAPESCFVARKANLETALGKLHATRMSAEQGLRALDEEDKRQRSLLDSNAGLQTVLRARAADMLRTGASGLTFQGKPYSSADAATQAQLLVQEQAGFTAMIATLAGRRSRLSDARMAATVEENHVTGALATLSADKAILESTGSLDRARELLAHSEIAEGRVDAVTEAVVRSTQELSPPKAAASQAPGFDFQSWVSGGGAATQPAVPVAPSQPAPAASPSAATP